MADRPPALPRLPLFGLGGGSGLGLTIAQRIIDHLGSRIEVNSRAGSGSTFRVLLKQASEET